MFCLVLGICFLAHSHLFAGKKPAYQNEWSPLIQEKKYKEARVLCERWLKLKSRLAKIEAHKCLANVELGEAEEIIMLEGNDTGGGLIRGGYIGPAVDRAVEHLNKGIELAPNDLSIHQGRLHLLLLSGRYDELPKYLKNSILTYKGENAIEEWLPYGYDLFTDNHLHAALAYYRVLEKYYPRSHKVIANIGAILTMLEKDDDAIVYAKKAVELAPNDPINNWNLARLYHYTNKFDLAEKYYVKSLSLESNVNKKKELSCVFAEFLEKKLEDLDRACELQKENCDKEHQTACK